LAKSVKHRIMGAARNDAGVGVSVGES
jgi:hypothetical protein